MDPDDSIQVYAQILRKTTYTRIIACLCALVVVLKLLQAEEGSNRGKRIRKGNSFYREIVHSTEVDCHDQIRMSQAAFSKLAMILRQRGTLKDSRHLTIDEQLVMFLHTLGHNLRNRKIAHNFGHSGETVSRYFHKVLTSILALHGDYFKLPGPGTPPEITRNTRMVLYFKVHCLVF